MKTTVTLHSSAYCWNIVNLNLKLALEKNIDELENLKELVSDSWLTPRDTDYCANQYYYYYVNHVNSILNSDPYGKYIFNSMYPNVFCFLLFRSFWCMGHTRGCRAATCASELRVVCDWRTQMPSIRIWWNFERNLKASHLTIFQIRDGLEGG